MELNSKTFTKTKMRPNEYTNNPRCKKSDSCQSCVYTINDGRLLRCGFDYFQVPAPERRTPKLTSFPEVAQDRSS